MNMLNQKFTKILVNFEMLVDLDLLIVKYVLFKYNKSKYIKEEAKEYTSYFIRLLLNSRRYWNPLSIIFKDEYVKNVSNIYEEILTKYKKELFEMDDEPYTTSIYNLFKIFDNIESGYKITINCNDKYELEQAKKMFNDKADFDFKIKEYSLKEYFTLYVKDYISLSKFEIPITGKTIYLLNYGPNYTIDETTGKETIHPIIEMIMSQNKIKMIDQYSNLKFPKEVGGEENEISKQRSQ